MESTQASIRTQKRRDDDPSRLMQFVFKQGQEPDAQIANLQIDGAWKKRNNTNDMKAAVGWRLTGREGDTIIEKGLRVQAISPLQAEALALLYGLDDIPQNIHHIDIFTDSSVLVKALQNPDDAPIEIQGIVRDCLIVLNRFSFGRCTKVPRELVAYAHTLATKARCLGATI